MAKIRIVGDSSGYVEIAAPSAAGNNTLELPSSGTRLTAADSSGNLSVSGILTVSAGSTSIPSISPSGDSNTGIFFPSADTIAFGEGGVESARFDSSGRLGIGTVNPSYLLHTSGTGGTIGHQLTTNSSTIRYTNSNTTAEWTAGTSSPGLANAGNYYSITQLGTDSTWRERLVIDSSGRITAPYQPAFAAYRNIVTSYTSGQTIIWNIKLFDRQNNYDTSNGRFTAPISGVYLLRADFRSDTTSSAPILDIVTSNGYRTRHEETAGSVNVYHDTLCMVCYMSTGDYAYVECQGGSIRMDTNQVNNFAGFLVG